MEHKSLVKWLKIIIIGAFICMVLLYTYVIPEYCDSIKESYPEFAGRFAPWIIFVWIAGLPCFCALFIMWKLCTNISHDRSFTEENARLVRCISVLAALDSAFFFAGNIVLLLFNMSHPSIVLASLVIVFTGVAIAVASALLSRLISKAAKLQEENDLTI